MPITKRPCANCPFRRDGRGIELAQGALQEIVQNLLEDDHGTFVCHKTIGPSQMTCAGAVAVLSKIGRLPVIARLALALREISTSDIEASSAMVIDPSELGLQAEIGQIFENS